MFSDSLKIRTQKHDLDIQQAIKSEHDFGAQVQTQARNVTDETIIEFNQVTKTFHLYKNDTARFLGLFGIKRKNGYIGSVHANDDLSFTIKRGEAVAFLGKNGAGKSTALKMVTGVMYPTKGTVTVSGRVSALLELSAGFNKNLNAKENIDLRGQALGLTRKQTKELEPKILEFAELGMYGDQPMRTYSSGMKARLGFAFMVSTDPEIFVVDETLSVGDKEFRKKCIARIREIIKDENVTVLFVTHATEIAKEFCTRGIVLKNGAKVFDGPIGKAILFYDETSAQEAQKLRKKRKKLKKAAKSAKEEAIIDVQKTTASELGE